MAFPTLKYKSVDTTPEDNSLKSSPQDGKVIARSRFTKTRKTFSASLTKQKDADYALLLAFYNTVETVLSFQWTNPIDTTIYVVRFATPLVGKKNAKFPDHYDVDTLSLVEV